MAQASAGIFPRQRNRGGNRNGGGGGGANNGANNGTDGGAGGANNSTGNGGGGNNNDDPQTSLSMIMLLFFRWIKLKFPSPALDPGVIAQGFANDGQDVPADGISSLSFRNPNIELTIFLFYFYQVKLPL